LVCSTVARGSVERIDPAAAVRDRAVLRVLTDIGYLPTQDTIADPLGVKGLGELVIVAVPAAIANAVFNATGRGVTDLPITLEKVLSPASAYSGAAGPATGRR
jgi:hypothetical protein